MAQLFARQTNWLARAVAIGIPVVLMLWFGVAESLDRSPYITEVGDYVDQPVPFSHEHHVGEVGLDCRYCHTQVERGPVAQIPPSETCLTCHSQIWKTSPMLSAVRRTGESGAPLVWQKVTKIPQFVFFNHRIHIEKGVGCVSCHGSVDHMQLTTLAHPMQMRLCIDCHENPSPNLRPRSEVTNPAVEIPKMESDEAARLGAHVQSRLDCVTCHR